MASFIIVLTSESFCLYALDRLSPFCNWRVLLLDSKFQAMIEALSLTPRCRCKKPLSAVLTSEARWRRCVRRCPHKSRSMSYRHYYRRYLRYRTVGSTVPTVPASTYGRYRGTVGTVVPWYHGTVFTGPYSIRVFNKDK